MRFLERLGKLCVVFGVCALATFFANSFGGGSLWQTFDPALAGTGNAGAPKAPYDLTRLEAVNETLKMIRDKYVDPDRVKPKEMLLSALNYVQRDVAQVIVLTDDPNVAFKDVNWALLVGSKPRGPGIGPCPSSWAL